MSSLHSAVATGSCLLFLAVAGCGHNASTVVGSVTLDGQLIENGTIAFTPVDGKTATAGAFITKGNFSQQVPVGLMKVAITSPRNSGKRKATSYDGTPVEIDLITESIPKRYNKKSTLSIDVKQGVNRVQYDLQSQP